METNKVSAAWSYLTNSPLLRIIFLLFLILMLQIPIGMIKGVIGERQSRRNQVIDEITSKWGKSQTIIGPYITVPYIVEIIETSRNKSDDDEKLITTRKETRYAKFLPENLDISGNINCEIRYRGIFKTPIYHMDLDIKGQFAQPDFTEWEIDSDQILWNRAYLTIQISDAHAITNPIALSWNNTNLNFLPGGGEFDQGVAGIHVNLKNQLENKSYPFECKLALNGSQRAFFAPFGRETMINITSNWSAPSFQGTWLPSQRELNDDGFQATWSIPSLGRNFPQQWKSNTGVENQVFKSLFGVDFLTSIDHYRMAQRSVKYEMLFLVLTFATLWLFEILAKVRIHSIQYLFVGAGMCLFYLLELSLAEHIGFIAAYICAAAAIIILISAYCVAVLKKTQRALIIAAAIFLLYGYLYVLLMNQDYALLIGSLGLFVILALVMYLTRKIEWHTLKLGQ